LQGPLFYQAEIFGLYGDEPPIQAEAWLSFLKLYYESTTPAEGFSVCTLGIDATKKPQPGQLLINPGVSNPTDSGGHDIETEVAREADSVLVEFGDDLTPIMDSLPALQKRRRAMATTSAGGPRSYEPRPSRHRRAHGSITSRDRRQLQFADYLILFGGDVKGQFDESVYSALWDRNLYFVGDDSGSFDVLFAFDNGEGSKEIPVIWVPPTETGAPSMDSSDILEMSIGITEGGLFVNATGGER
jgi:hypothetical protein